MASATTRGRICLLCRNDETCIYPRNSGRPVTECGEFEGYVLPQPKCTPAAGTAPDNGASLARQQQNDCGPFLGLCVNCEDRETCIYPKPEGGVWRCEEYR
jgi:hypothetical protein